MPVLHNADVDLALFITNNPRGGSSLYLVHPKGTIRCSGANYLGRRATTFVRPYLMGYLRYLRGHQNGLFKHPQVGLYPFEAAAYDYVALSHSIKSGSGHHGNLIVELLSMQDLQNLSFVPKTWQGEDKNGIPWQVAKSEVLYAYAAVHANHFLFVANDFPVNREKYSIKLKWRAEAAGSDQAALLSKPMQPRSK